MEFSPPVEITAGAGLIKLSPNGQRLAHVQNSNIVIRDTDSLKPVITLSCSEPLVRLDWAPDSACIFGISARRAAILVR